MYKLESIQFKLLSFHHPFIQIQCSKGLYISITRGNVKIKACYRGHSVYSGEPAVAVN